MSNFQILHLVEPFAPFLRKTKLPLRLLNVPSLDLFINLPFVYTKIFGSVDASGIRQAIATSTTLIQAATLPPRLVVAILPRYHVLSDMHLLVLQSVTSSQKLFTNQCVKVQPRTRCKILLYHINKHALHYLLTQYGDSYIVLVE